MGNKYPNSAPPSLDDTPIDGETLKAMGSIVRSFATIEDYITLHIAAMLGTNEGIVLLLLGRLAMKNRIAVARNLAKLKFPNTIEKHRMIFGGDFNEVLELRNAIAHGAYLGRTEDGRYVFRINQIDAIEQNRTELPALSHDPKRIIAAAEVLNERLPEIAKLFQIEALLQARLEAKLEPHRKARKSASPKTKRPKPRPPSPA